MELVSTCKMDKQLKKKILTNLYNNLSQSSNAYQLNYFNVNSAPTIQKLQILVNKHKILTCLKDENYREESVCEECLVYKFIMVPCTLQPSFSGSQITTNNYATTASMFSFGPNLNTCKEPISNIDDIKNIIKQIEEHFRK